MWVIIAAFNEDKKIGPVIEGVKEFAKNVVVVDDGSEDKTFDVAKKTGVTVLKHVINLGKGAAMRTGAEFAIDKGAKKLVFIDADGQHEPKDIPRFVKELDDVEFVFSYRKFDENMPFVRRFGNWFLNFYTKVLFGITVYDTQCGLRAFRADIYDKIKWESDRYAVETEQVMRVGRSKVSYSQLPIRTIYEDRSPGTTINDGFKIAFRMLQLRFRK